MVNSISGFGAVNNTIAGDLSGTARPESLEQAAQQFEALFLRSMLQQMRKAADVLAADDDPFNSKQQRMMRELYDDTLATSLASQRSGGIANMLIQQLGSKDVK
ncbi:rod-binding protein [Pragia fontium]|uniref:Flagellar protein FlgJ n=2 Tax=Pragia fontium TaxID=82985 RepID=A0AAJ4W7N8_9GAMM|nr:rod-binding protein [Pragia fontium]AKJ41390.1 peptidoglycan hydrolase [Pragia fontium]SFC01370.1 flagellar protein FlgJ [Pragia fontium DSM 5563 = ATCC 49100]SUB81640.1 peptidoglycan hydrolase [Pragia fontium]VEJ54118.1 peptidoglycan hydrolase [Pragia fontium]GKX62947.1 peptidoglycan hydrolase [Pragia fontium]